MWIMKDLKNQVTVCGYEKWAKLENIENTIFRAMLDTILHIITNFLLIRKHLYESEHYIPLSLSY
jgi:hypothetical protein